MSNVTLQIAGHSYTIACAEGEEDHVLGLGRLIDSKLDSMPNASGQSEARMLLFASLLLADELHELKQRQPATDMGTPDGMPDITDQLVHLANKFENLADLLER